MARCPSRSCHSASRFAAMRMIYRSTDLMLVVTSNEESITDNCYSIEKTLNVTIEYVSLYVDIQHTFRGDLRVNVRTW